MHPLSASRPHTRTALVTGLILALLLTFASFGVVVAGLVGPATGLIALAVLAILQMLVHFRYFFNIGRGGTTMEINFALLFAVVLIAIMVGGTLWIMFDLHMRMMG